MKYYFIIAVLVILVFLFTMQNEILSQFLNFINGDTYLHTTDWSQIDNINEYEQNGEINGIETRVLEPPHILAGEKGIFATKEYSKYSVVGEYTGSIVRYNDVNHDNKYIFGLVDDICINAEKYGNELKYVNSYINIEDEPNLTCSLCYINKKPRILYVCTKDISVGEELLIDYGNEYNERFIL